MSRRDRGIALVLVVVLAVIGAAMGMPSSTSAPAASPTASAAPLVYREGVVGAPSSINPLTARTQADRDLVALVFSGLVRLGPDGTISPDLAESWTVDPSGATYAFTIRPDATWQDGVPVTAADVVFTVGIIQDPAYTGIWSSSWDEVTATATGPRTVKFVLKTPLGGFLTAARLPILPQHLLQGVPVAQLADAPFSLTPVGSGPFRLLNLDKTRALLEPVARSAAASASPTLLPSDPGETLLGTAPRLPRTEVYFYPDAKTLAAALAAGKVDAAGGMPPAMAAAAASRPGMRSISYPTTTLTSVILNQRPQHPEFKDPAVRLALLEAIDRNGIVQDVLAGNGARADSLIPPSSWAFSPASAPTVPYSSKAAVAALTKAGWKQTAAGWTPKGAKIPLTIELITPDSASNPMAYATALAVAADWEAIGLIVNLVPLPAKTYTSERLETGQFQAAIVNVDLGLDPDLYPLLASSQVAQGGSNVAGVQDVSLDRLLVAARSPGTMTARMAAYATLQKYLASHVEMLPIDFQDYLFVASNRLIGPESRQISDAADRYWDVLDWRLVGGR